MATSNVKNQENVEENEELLQAIKTFSESLKITNNAAKKIVYLDPVSYSENINLLVGPEAERNMSASPGPSHKIIKKKYKQSRSRRIPKIPKSHQNGSPISKEQIRLLHDPRSINKYVKELDLERLRLLNSEKKPKKQKLRKSSSKAKSKKSKKKVSPFRTQEIFIKYGNSPGYIKIFKNRTLINLKLYAIND